MNRSKNSLYLFLLVVLMLVVIPLAFPSHTAEFRCCLATKSEQGMPEGFWDRLSYLREKASKLRKKSVSELSGQHSLEYKKILPESYLKESKGGPGFEFTGVGSRGPEYLVIPRKGKTWKIPVGGTPGVSPAWSEKALKFAFIRLGRIWLSNEQGTIFADVARLPEMSKGVSLLWNCNGTRLAAGNPSSGWWLLDFEKQK